MNFSFWLVLLVPFLHSLVVIIDKFLVINYSKKEEGSGGLIIFSSLVNIFVASGIIIFIPSVFNISFTDKIILILIGFLTAVWFILYLYAIEKEDGSIISAWFLSVPIFSYPMSYLLLGESLSANQILGSIVIILGLIFISINWTEEKIKIRSKKAIIFMTIACFIIAFSGVLFKYITIKDGGDFWVSSFWEYLGLGIAGIFMFLFIPKYKKEFIEMNKDGGAKIFSLNIFNESLTIIGNLIMNFVILIVPVTLVYMVGSFQPIILLFLAIILKRFLPKLINENLNKKELIIKFISIIVVILGSLILFI